MTVKTSCILVKYMTNQSLAVVRNRRQDIPEARLIALVCDAVSSPQTRVAYARSLKIFFAFRSKHGSGPFSRALVNAWKSDQERQGFAPATVNIRLSAVRKLATEAAENGLLDPDIARAIQGVKGAQRRGVRSGNWLTRDQTQAILLAPDIATLRGKRDRALLAVLFGTGLRRSEASALTVSHIQQRDGRWAIVDLIGKHQRTRTIPVPAWVVVALNRWTDAAEITEGRVFRAVNKSDKVWGAGITDKVIREVVCEYADAIGVAQFSAHDARRTFAKLCRGTGGELEQIQLLLGHASVATTERYLGTQLRMIDAVNDRLRMTA